MALDQSWRPDWMDLNTGVYIDHGDDLSAWAWEFLRRNPEYQADFERWAALPDTWEGGESPKFDNTVGDWVLMEFCADLPNAPAAPWETVQAYERRTGHWPQTLYAMIGNKWLISPTNPLDPCPNATIGPMAPPYSLAYQTTVGNEKLPTRFQNFVLYAAGWDVDDVYFVDPVGFDLRFNIDEQWEAIRQSLLDRQKGDVGLFGGEAIERIKRPQIKKNDSYETKLRYLDAVAAGATDEQIINKLYSGESMASSSTMGACDEEIRLESNGKKWLKDLKTEANSLMASKFQTLFTFDLIPRTKKDEKRRESRKK